MATKSPSTTVPDATVSTLETTQAIVGPWSLATSRRFWEGFAPSALAVQSHHNEIRASFLCDTDWQRAEFIVRQEGSTAQIAVTGSGDIEAATAQVLRFLSLDIDGNDWLSVGDRDPVIAAAQQHLPGFRPCGFYSPYEAAAWAVLSQRVQIRQAATLAARIIETHGDRGTFPAPSVLLGLDLDLPGRKNEYLNAVAEAALDGELNGERLRGLDAGEALRQVQTIHGLGPFAAELVVIRGANFPDVLPTNEKRLNSEIALRYGADRSIAEITEKWRPFRSWASVNLRALRAERTDALDGR